MTRHQVSRASSSSLDGNDDDTGPIPRPGIISFASCGTTARSQSPAASLPFELIMEIFKYITKPADIRSTVLVCKSWCACSVEKLWFKPFLYQTTSLLQFMAAVRKERPSFEYPLFIKRLNLTYLNEHMSDQILTKLSPCKRLERLTLIGCNRLTDRGLCDILSRNTGITAMDLTGLELITDLSILVAATKNRSLQGLNLTQCVHLTDDSIVSVATTCRHLRRV